MTSPPAASDRRAIPDEEYRARARAPRRRLTVPLLTGLVVAIGVALALVMALRSNRSMSVTVSGYHTTDTGIKMTVVLDRPDADRDVVCVLRALGRDRSVLGTARTTIVAGERETTFTRTIRASSRPVAGDVQSCRYR
jgi:uncharacterized protein DUF4307